MKISVQYPTVEEKVIKTAKEMKALGYSEKAQIAYIPVNRISDIRVNKLSRKVQEEFMNEDDYQFELSEQAQDLTGMSRSQYQIKYATAWNE